jgi:hypothetical protein
MASKPAIVDPFKDLRFANVRALKVFNDWERGEVRHVAVDSFVASLIVNGYLEEVH